MTVIFFADSNRFRVHQAKFEPNAWGRPILMAPSIPSIPFTNPNPPPPPSPPGICSFQLSKTKWQMPGPRLELTEPLDLNTIIPYSLLDLQAPVPGKPIIANPGLNIAWTWIARARRRLVQTWPDGPEICLNLQSMMTAHYFCQKGFGPKALSPIMGYCLSLNLFYCK